MDIRQLRALAAVAHHRSFTGAARALHTVQSNVSAHISRLERELGVELIDRATIELTPEGHALMARVTRIEAELAAIQSDLAELRDDVSGAVHLGMIGTVARWIVPNLLESLWTAHPRIELTIHDGTSSLLIPQLVGGVLDLALITLPAEEPAVEVTPLFEEDRVLVVPPDHPLAERDQVTLAEVSAYELLIDAPGTAFRDELDQLAETHGLTFRALAEIDGLRLLASLAFAGFGAAIIPASGAPAGSTGGCTVVPIDDAPRRQVGIARARAALPSAAQRAVADLITAAVDAATNDHPSLHSIVRAPRM